MIYRLISALFFTLAMSGVAAETYTWKQSSETLALETINGVVWQLNYKPSEGKPYFHPIRLVDGTVITSARPADHPWHRGLWFSWKYINHVNYWEEDKLGNSEGQTELLKVLVTTNSDFSARIEMELSYHPRGKAPVLTEKRVLTISRPDERGNFTIDHFSHFKAGVEALQFDRTPPQNASGGYAGLSVRLAPEMKSWVYNSSEGNTGAAANYGKKADWLDFSGSNGGITLFDSPKNLRHPTPWYPNQSMPWFTPAFLFHEPFVLQAEKELELRYRVLVHSGSFDKTLLESEWQVFANDRQN